jgi:uncharacterized protein (DUF302 family)
MRRVVVKRSASGYRETVVRVIDAIESRGLRLSTRIDHARRGTRGLP